MVDDLLRLIGLLAPATGLGRGHYFASRGAAALAAAFIMMIAGYGLAQGRPGGAGQLVEAAIALLTAATYVLAVRCFIGFWSVPASQRRAELLLASSTNDAWILRVGFAVSVLGFAGLALIALARL